MPYSKPYYGSRPMRALTVISLPLLLLISACSDSPTAPSSTVLDGRVFYSLDHAHPTRTSEVTVLNSWVFSDTGPGEGRYRYETEIVYRLGDIGLPEGINLTYWSNGRYRQVGEGFYLMRDKGGSFDPSTYDYSELSFAIKSGVVYLIDFGDKVRWAGLDYSVTDRENLESIRANPPVE